MAQRTFLHVGPPKTGTSYLQSGWRAEQPRLLEAGLLYPGTADADHFRACVLATQHPTYAPRLTGEQARTWDRFRDEIAAHDGDALLSSEFYARADLETATRIVNQLRACSSEVHLVITARDLGRQVVAAWQQQVKRGGTRTLEEFWASAHNGGLVQRNFWRGQDLPALAQRWRDAGADAASLVVVGAPGAAKDQLWHDTSGLLGVTAEPVPHVPSPNRGLGAVETEVLRRMHTALPRERDKVRSSHLSSKFFTDQLRALDLPRASIAVPAALAEAVHDRADAKVAELKALQRAGALTVVGDLDHLSPLIETVPEQVDDTLVAEAATRVLGALVAHEANSRNEADALRSELAAQTRAHAEELRIKPSLLRIVRRLTRLERAGDETAQR